GPADPIFCAGGISEEYFWSAAYGAATADAPRHHGIFFEKPEYSPSRPPEYSTCIASFSSAKLTEQLDGAGIATCSKCGHSANSIHCHRAQELGQLTRGTGIEAAIGALG